MVGVPLKAKMPEVVLEEVPAPLGCVKVIETMGFVCQPRAARLVVV